MHAAIYQLLSLRDGEPVDADVVHHVERCAMCGAELARLKRVQQRMQSLAPIDAPPPAWDQIRGRLQSRPQRSRIGVAVAAAAVVAVVSGLIVREFGPSPLPVASSQQQQPTPLATIPLEQLVAQSRELDEMLHYLPERPSVERVAMAATIDTIEQRVQWLDQQLSYTPDAGLDDAQAYRLWRERVDLMDSLVKVRYVEGGPLSF